MSRYFNSRVQKPFVILVVILTVIWFTGWTGV